MGPGQVGVYNPGVPDTCVQNRPEASTEKANKRPRLWNVVLLNDEEHTYEYVIAMLRRLFGHPTEKAFLLAQKVDSDGRAICLTTHLEHAELKRDQVHAYGPDRAIASCKGAMSAVLEPAEFSDDDEESRGNDRRGQ